ncbi:MAG: response regulator [Deltaproteobacteria bacterium]|nr:response regulator [Deltaproteobacteria bacterium]
METVYDYQTCTILYVDDEEMALKYFTRAFENKFPILSALNATEGYRLLEQHREQIGLIITDQRMPGEKGVQFLERARQLHPKAIRILTTAYSDLNVAIEAVNSGAIYKYVTKPWDIPQLEMTLQRAVEFFLVQRERDLLLKEKLSVLQRMMITDRVLSLGILAARLGHYVRNSLVAVRTFMDLAPEKLVEEKMNAEQLRNPNFWKEFYEQAQIQIRRITELLTDLIIATETSGSPRLEQVELGKTVARSVQNLSEASLQHGITIVNLIPEGLPPLLVERGRFERLFDLLLKDEIISLPARSHVFLSACPRFGEDQELEIEIRDDGPGLPREALRSVFDPFFLRIENFQEFGINLMACYFIVYHHGGRINVRNLEGQGVTFTLTFPVRPRIVSPEAEEEAFITKVLMNDGFWEKLISGQHH